MAYMKSLFIGMMLAAFYLALECYGLVLILPIESAPLGWVVTFSNDVVRFMFG